MKKFLKPGTLLVAIAGVALAAGAQTQYPVILQQPVDQCLAVGGTATYSVEATNATGYQWLFDGTALDGETNSILTVANVTLGNVGNYSACVYNGADSVPTRSAALDVYMAASTSTPLTTTVNSMAMSLLAPSGGGDSSIVVFGLPVVSGGGKDNGCPGKYAGYVCFIPPQGWGFVPTNNASSYTATDTNQTNTKVQYGGMYGDVGCNLTTVTIPSPPMSPQYRFAIYFPNGSQVPTNAYPIVLNGFNP